MSGPKDQTERADTGDSARAIMTEIRSFAPVRITEACEIIEHAEALIDICGRAELQPIFDRFRSDDTNDDSELRAACETVSNELNTIVGDSVVVFTTTDDLDIAEGVHRGLALQHAMKQRKGIACLATATIAALDALSAAHRSREVIETGPSLGTAGSTTFIAMPFFQCVESMQTAWRELAYALTSLGGVPLIAEQMKDFEAVVARNQGRHKENRADKKRVLEWYQKHASRFVRNKTGAAEAAIREVGLNVNVETVRNWLKEPR